MAVDEEVVKYLASTAMMAGAFGMSAKAVTIAEALVAARPDDVDVQVVAASAKMAAGKTDESIRMLRDKVLAEQPGRSDAKALLGVGLHLKGSAAERDRVFDQVLAADDDPNAVLIAKDMQGS